MGQQSTIQPPWRVPILLGMALFSLLLASSAFSQTRATSIPLMLPSAIAYDAQGNLYIAETGNHVVRKVDAAGNITTVAGTGTQGFSGDGGGAISARLDSPQGLALDANRHLYIADTHNNRIRRLDLATGLITTIAGATQGFSGDNGAAINAHLNYPTALAVNAAGDLFIADTQNYRIRKIAAVTGVITTIAGNGIQGFSGDNGPATLAAIDSPSGLALDAAGDLYLSDTHNHRIRKVTAATGMISSIAGTGSAGFFGDSGLATAAAVALPHGLSFDSNGNLYVADTENNRVRRIDAATGVITTVTGQGTQGFSSRSASAATAALDSPRSVTISPYGMLTLSDSGNQRIRQIDVQAIPAIHTIAGLSPLAADTLILNAPAGIEYGSGELTASLNSSTSASGSVSLTLLNSGTGAVTTLGGAALVGNTASIDTSSLSAGSYTAQASYSGDGTHSSTQSAPLALHITPRPLIATPDPVTLLYGQPIPQLTGSLTGLLPRDSGDLTANFASPVTSSSPAAIYPISVSIAGSAAQNYAVTSMPGNITISPAPTVLSLVASAPSVVSGAPLTLTAHITSTIAGTPAGLVILSDGGTAILSLTADNGNAVFTAGTLAPGLHTLTATYAGNKNFLPSTSTPAVINVTPAPANSTDFALTSVGATIQTIPSGGSASFNFDVKIQGSTLASPITLSATGVPAFATASFNPAYLPPGATPNAFILTINTAQGSAFNRSVGSVLLFVCLCVPFSIGPRCRSRRKVALRLVLILSASSFIFCSGCGSRINTGNQTTIPAKAYTITVTGTATSPTGGILQHSTTVNLLVQSAE